MCPVQTQQHRWFECRAPLAYNALTRCQLQKTRRRTKKSVNNNQRLVGYCCLLWHFRCFFSLSFSHSSHFGWNVTVLEKTSIFTKRIGKKHTNPLLPFHLRLCWVMKTASLASGITVIQRILTINAIRNSHYFGHCLLLFHLRHHTPKYFSAGYVSEWVWMRKYRHLKCMKSTLSRFGLHRTQSTRKTDKTFFEHKLNKLFKRLALTFNFEWFGVMSSTWLVAYCVLANDDNNVLSLVTATVTMLHPNVHHCWPNTMEMSFFLSLFSSFLRFFFICS